LLVTCSPTRIGIDFGGVILDIRYISPHSTALPAMPQAMKSIATSHHPHKMPKLINNN
jgi:hypothetical protein